ncbi:MAG: hypothetical protein GXY06_09860 [Clostridiaceae bacterium]|nr:hypothetical protein [Clostridiaceae bacterium]
MSEFAKRVLMTIVGVSVGGFSVGMFIFSAFGTDPFQVLAHGIWRQTNLDFGTLYMIVNLVMLVGVFFVDKRKIGIGTAINIFVLGYVVSFSTKLFMSWMPDPELWVRIIFLIIGLLVLSLSAALYFTGDLGVSTYDAVAIILSEKTPIKFQYLRITSDIVCTLIGFLLGATVGIGTLVTAFFMGPMIAFFKHKIAMPMRYGKIRAKELVEEEHEKKRRARS